MNKNRMETNDLIAQNPIIAKKMKMRWLACWKIFTKTEWTGKAQKNPNTSNKYNFNDIN